MTTDNVQNPDSPSTINVVVFLDLLWRYRWLVGLVTAAAIAASLYIALTTRPVYKADVVVTPVSSDGGGMNSLASRFGGLASLAGVNLQSGGSNVQESLAVLKSRQLAEIFIARHKLVPKIMGNAPKQSLWLAVDKFRGTILSIRQEKEAGTTTLSVTWREPAETAQWANDYVALANEILRVRALNEASKNIKFLNEQIAKTQVVEVQRVLYGIIENETKTQMIASTREEYAFTVVDRASMPEDRVWPRRGIIVMSGAAVGGVLGALLALLVNFWRTHWQGRRA
ncbi:MAG TPA: Wzz/FepE/Etk N-terminal domain-containing protein [Steroidobacteraceae bacterium]|nr:Wzz/FepE/Etk N-terminal domain-containing protein [Steroidobacteraceae bacterium]